VPFAALFLSNGQAIGHHCQRSPAGQGNEISGFQGTIAKGKRLQAGFFTYLAAGSAVYKVWSH